MWTDLSHRLALLELWAQGRLRRRRSHAHAWDELVRLGWMRLTPRRDEATLDEAHRLRLEATLDACWSEWREVLARLRSEDLAPDERGWRELRRRERARDIPVALDRLNRRTATALVAAHSKATLTEVGLETLGSPEIMHDGLVRLRVPRGLRLERDGMAVDCDALSQVLGEIVLTERAFRDGLRLVGPVRAALSVENRGPYVDVEVPGGWLVVHAPGWDTVGVRLLMESFRAVPWLHFGDLDPQGAAIFRHFRQVREDVGWLVPGWWLEAVPSHGLRREWPEGLVEAGDPPLVCELARRGMWLEQESIALDPRLAGELESWLAACSG